ncbi:hypothetical protein BVG16_27795 [Paenibacillus selenitireducens]|uniref:N-acetyltransferase domain-containing protein n=1 Tax=Paenibacillus selenitireducens TaxID=1324314 RepID=A0A1T2X183_9BACL|nr:hypothetical protein BVG16_27795 [Paenibacillus selenitireducens]
METNDQVFAKTNRLILRGFSINDTESFHLYRSNPEVAKFQSWENYGNEINKRKLLLINDRFIF